MPQVSSRFVNVGGIRTHYLEAGEGPLVVLLHSGEFGGCAELTWERNISALAQDFRVIAPDWLGFGETDKLYDFVSGGERRMRHLIALLEVLSIDQADFIGASMGGTVLVKEVASGSCRLPIRRMILSSGGGYVPDNEWRRRLLGYDGTTEAMREVLHANFHDPAWADDDAYVERRVRASLQPGAWEVINAARLKAPNVPPRSTFGQPDTTRYENVTVPTLIFVGAEDKLREPGYHRDMTRRIANVRVHVVEGAGHLLNIESAEEFNRIAHAFLTGPAESRVPAAARSGGGRG